MGAKRHHQADTPIHPLDRLAAEAIRFLAPERTEAMLRQFLSHAPAPAGASDRLKLQAQALMFATDVVLSTPSTSGSTAFDRLARNRTDLDAEEQAALRALRRARHRIARVDRLTDRGQWRLRDLASRDTLVLPGGDLPAGAAGIAIMARFAPLDDGTHVVAGPVVPLDDMALEVARGFMRPGGSTLVNPLRCIETVYRHVLRHGMIDIPGLNTSLGDVPEGPLPEPAAKPLDALAHAWSLLEDGVEPDEAGLQRVRSMAVQVHLIGSLINAIVARDAGRRRLADSYTRIAHVMIQTMVLREAHGSALGGLQETSAAIDRFVAQRQMPPGVRTLFDNLRARAGTAPTGSAAKNDAELERLVQRIRGLRAKTVEQGCTEGEALAAAEKVAELLDRHGLSLSELDLRRQRCEGIGIDTDRRRRGPIDECVAVIGSFFDCRVWGETSPTGTLRYVFFGLPGDVQAADYLYDLVERAFATETATFQRGTFYREAQAGERRSATNSFQIGLARGIRGKLDALRRARETVLCNGSGRELVPIKGAIVEAELAKLGLRFTSRARTIRRSVVSDAFEAGKEAGERFDYRPGLSHANAA